MLALLTIHRNKTLPCFFFKINNVKESLFNGLVVIVFNKFVYCKWFYLRFAACYTMYMIIHPFKLFHSFHIYKINFYVYIYWKRVPQQRYSWPLIIRFLSWSACLTIALQLNFRLQTHLKNRNYYIIIVLYLIQTHKCILYAYVSVCLRFFCILPQSDMMMWWCTLYFALPLAE